MRYLPVELCRFSLRAVEGEGLHVFLEGICRGRSVDTLVGPFAVATRWGDLQIFF